MWSIYKKPDQPGDNPEVDDLLAKYPDTVSADGENYIFVDTHPTANNPILASELVDENDEPLRGRELAKEIQYLIHLDDRTRPIHLTKRQANRFYFLPEWQLWLGNDRGGGNRNRADEYADAYEASFPDETKASRIADKEQMRDDTRNLVRTAIRKKFRAEKRKREAERQ